MKTCWNYSTPFECAFKHRFYHQKSENFSGKQASKIRVGNNLLKSDQLLISLYIVTCVCHVQGQ